MAWLPGCRDLVSHLRSRSPWSALRIIFPFSLTLAHFRTQILHLACFLASFHFVLFLFLSDIILSFQTERSRSFSQKLQDFCESYWCSLHQEKKSHPHNLLFWLWVLLRRLKNNALKLPRNPIVAFRDTLNPFKGSCVGPRNSLILLPF